MKLKNPKKLLTMAIISFFSAALLSGFKAPINFEKIAIDLSLKSQNTFVLSNNTLNKSIANCSSCHTDKKIDASLERNNEIQHFINKASLFPPQIKPHT
jgi:hypothetical protein